MYIIYQLSVGKDTIDIIDYRVTKYDNVYYNNMEMVTISKKDKNKKNFKEVFNEIEIIG